MRARTFDARPLLGKLALSAEGFDFYRTAQQCELSQAGFTREKLLHVRYFDVLYASASDAKDMVMRLHVAVIAGDIVQERYLARLSHFAKLLQNPMDCRQRYVGMLATYCCADLVGAGMVLGIEQGLYDCEPLRCDGDPALTAARDELAESLNRISLAGAPIHQPDFWHETTPVPPTSLDATENDRLGKGAMTAERLDKR